MPATTRAPMSRPHGAPAYYLARPASWWLSRQSANRRAGQLSGRYLGYE
jgi:hypothetical protein